jgi:hypothetical protein
MSQAHKKEEDARASHTSNGSVTGSDKVEGRPYLPNKASVLSEKEFTSPTGKRYRIIRTDETDPYDAHGPRKKQPGQRDDSS